MQVRLVFDTGYELTVELFDNDFVNRWSRLLDREITRGSLLQEHTYSSFAPEEFARQCLLQSIDTVNKFLKREFIPIPCDLDFESVEFYNTLHSKFEQLSGPDWDRPTRLMQLAPNEVKYAIKSINRWCHRLESRPYKILPYMRVEFETGDRELLLETDYDLFSETIDEDTVTLDYSTLGKSLRECYNDRLSGDYTGLKIQHHYAANFLINSKISINNNDFSNWCYQQGIQDIPKTELGLLPLGKVIQPKWYEAVQKTTKILSITLE